jgi:hypothetical protein
MNTNTSLDTPLAFQRRLNWLMVAFAVASLIHFIHNAEFIVDYPGMPKNWTTNGVYGAWIVMTLFGLIAWLLTHTKLKALGLILVMLYAVCGLDSLGHYWVAPIHAHQTMVNVTIFLEVFCALVLLLHTIFYFFKSRR